MSNWYLIGDGTATFAERDFAVVQADTSELALEQYIGQVSIHDQEFIEYVYDRNIGTGFAKSFYLMTPEDNERFWTTGQVPIDETELSQRVAKFFGAYHEFADLYTRYLLSEEVMRFPNDMLFYIYWQLHDSGNWTQLEVIPVQDVLL